MRIALMWLLRSLDGVRPKELGCKIRSNPKSFSSLHDIQARNRERGSICINSITSSKQLKELLKKRSLRGSQGATAAKQAKPIISVKT